MNAMETFELESISHVQNFGWQCSRKKSVGDSLKMSVTEFFVLDTEIMSVVSQLNEGYMIYHNDLYHWSSNFNLERTDLFNGIKNAFVESKTMDAKFIIFIFWLLFEFFYDKLLKKASIWLFKYPRRGSGQVF